MQTFLPLPPVRHPSGVSFIPSMVVLDRHRLGKQRVEAYQIAKAIALGGGWANHPAVNMWRGYTNALFAYAYDACKVWIERGYQDTVASKLDELYANVFSSDDCSLHHIELPSWMGDEQFHLSHRSNLLRKFPGHYRKYWPFEPDDLPYVWPVK